MKKTNEITIEVHWYCCCLSYYSRLLSFRIYLFFNIFFCLVTGSSPFISIWIYENTEQMVDEINKRKNLTFCKHIKRRHSINFHTHNIKIVKYWYECRISRGASLIYSCIYDLNICKGGSWEPVFSGTLPFISSYYFFVLVSFFVILLHMVFVMISTASKGHLRMYYHKYLRYLTLLEIFFLFSRSLTRQNLQNRMSVRFQ